MANEEHLNLLKQGVAQWNEWRKLNQRIQPDLSGANLRDTRLAHTNLAWTWLNGANLRDADLYGADLYGADLYGADLRGANLNSTNLSNVHLRNANLQGAVTYHTIFSSVDLRAVKGLVEIRHRGPSHIALYGVQLPQDGTALHFLRGAGVPDEWIDLYRTQMAYPIQYHSCFISYSNKDETLAFRLHSDLQAKGVRCWFAPEDLKIGNKFRQCIDEAIHLQDKLLLLLSEHSIASSWVENEVEAALEKEERQQREVLFPVRLDDSVMQTSQAWAATLRRTRHIGDFTNWTDPQVYQIAFKRLLDDLRKTDERQDQETKQ